MRLTLMSKRCIWSKRQDHGTRELTLDPSGRSSRAEVVQVCPAHETQVRQYYDRCSRYGGWFLAIYGLIVFAALILWALGIEEDAVAGGVFTCVGVAVVVFPFATPQTVEMMGVNPSVILCRVAGVGMVGWGIYMLVGLS